MKEIQKKEKNKKRLYITIAILIVILIVLADLILYWTSAQDDGIARGFSRFWNP